MTRLYSRQVARARLEFDASRALKSRGILSLSVSPLLLNANPTPRRLSATLFSSRSNHRTAEGHANFRGEPAGGGVKVAARHPRDDGERLRDARYPPQTRKTKNTLLPVIFSSAGEGGTKQGTRRTFVPAMNPTPRRASSCRGHDDEH